MRYEIHIQGTGAIIMYVFVICVTFGLLATSAASAGEGWRLVRTVANGNVEIVVVDKNRVMDTDVYRFAIAESRCMKDVLRGRRNLCKVMFWNDPAMTPTRFPMTAAQSRALAADWIYNGHTGYRHLLWSCRIVNDPSQCFSEDNH